MVTKIYFSHYYNGCPIMVVLFELNWSSKL